MLGYGPHALKRYCNDKVAGWLIFFKKVPAAQALYEQNLALHPNDAHAKNCLAGIFANSGDQERALAYYAELTIAQPKQAAYVFNQAFIHEKLGNTDQALALFQKTLDIEPSFDRAHYGMGLSYIRLNQLDKALESLKANTKLQPMSPYGWYQMALVYMNQGNVVEAYKTHAHLNRFDPKYARGLKIDLDKLAV